MCVVCVLCKDFRLVQQWEAEQLARCQLHWEVIWVEGRAEQLWSAAACEKCCSYTPTRNPIHYETEACLLTLCHTEHKRLWIGALTSAGESVCLSKYLGHLRRLQCAYMSVSYHWMISVIWASQWATLSFLSASSLISSSSCLLELLIFSYMVVSYRNENKRGGRRACY